MSRMVFIKSLMVLTLFSFIGCGQQEVNEQNFSLDLDENIDFAVNQADAIDICPITDFSPDRLTFQQDDSNAPYVDHNRPLKDLGTDIVVQKFFSEPEMLYNFMKLVYRTIGTNLDRYIQDNNMRNDSIHLLFKGGNVLRMIFHEFLESLDPRARELLSDFYKKYFKRSDADFSVYLDEKKLGSRNYDTVLDELADLVYVQLNKLRDEFKRKPQRYFNFFQLNNKFSSNELNTYFAQIEDLGISENEENPVWYKSKVLQMRLLNAIAGSKRDCSYEGNFDWKFTFNDNNEVVGTRLSDTTDWIVNTDNRALEFPMGTVPNAVVKFFLVRSKAYFKYIYKNAQGATLSKTIGGELIDVSFPHRKDFTVRGLLDNFEELVTTYTLRNNAGDSFKMKAYTIAGLLEDLERILFVQFDRPWNGGPKYAKRLFRSFLLLNIEMIGEYGLGSSKAKSYLDTVRETIIWPMEELFFGGKAVKEIAQEILSAAENLPDKSLVENNLFWKKVGKMVMAIADDQMEDDRENYKLFLDTLKENLEISKQLSNMATSQPIQVEELYNVDINNLF